MDSNKTWNTPTQARNEIQQKHTPIDYIRLCQQSDVIFLSENHSNTPVRYHLCAHVGALKQAGITHFAVEAAIGTNRFPSDPSSYTRLCHDLSAQGIQVVLVDIDQSSKPSPEEREAYITRNIIEILEGEQGVKFAVLIGRGHTVRTNFSNIFSTATRIESAGYSLTRLVFCGGFDFVPSIITDSARISSLSQKEFMIDLRPYGREAPFGGDADYAIHLPQQR